MKIQEPKLLTHRIESLTMTPYQLISFPKSHLNTPLLPQNPSIAPIHSLSDFQNLPTRRIARPLPSNLARHVEPPIRKNPPPYELASPCSGPPLSLPSIPMHLSVPESPVGPTYFTPPLSIFAIEFPIQFPCTSTREGPLENAVGP
jgi:hypothetical protein